MNMNFAAIDFELANNTDPYAVCSVGLAVVVNGQIDKFFYSLINPHTSFNGYCVRVHGISESDVQNAPDFCELWPTLEALIGNLPLVAHNKSCDLRALSGCLEHYHISYNMPTALCTLELSRQLLPGRRTYRLDALCRSIGYSFAAHNALEDAKACAALLIHLAELSGAASFDELLAIESAILPAVPPQVEALEDLVSLDDDALLGQCFSFTGDLDSLSRDDAESIVKRYGAIIAPSVSRYTTVLVVGNYAPGALKTSISAKHQKALDFISKGQNIEIMSEDDFLGVLAGKKLIMASPSIKPELMEFCDRTILRDPHYAHCFPEVRPILKGMAIYFYKQKAATLTYTKSAGYCLEIDAGYVDNPDATGLSYEIVKAKTSVAGEELSWQVIAYRFCVDLKNDAAVIALFMDSISADKFYSANVESFGCCSSFRLCSDAKECLHLAEWDYVGCEYRRNLEAGRVFYGKNKNS